MGIMYAASSIKEVNGQLSIPGGVPIQMLEFRTTSSLSTANWATQNELFTGSITPTSVNSKILIYVCGHFRMDAGAGTWSLGYMWVHNTTRNVNCITSGWNGTWRQTISSYTRQFLDSPNSTATQTYSFRVGNYPSGTTHWNNSGQNGHDGYSYMRLTEISA